MCGLCNRKSASPFASDLRRLISHGIFAGEGARATRPASTSVTCGARRKRPTSLSLNGDSLSGARIERASVVRFPAHRREKMKSKILVLGFACLSLVAVAQSNEKQSKEKQNQPAAAVKV